MVKITKKAQNGDRVTVDKKGLYTRLSKYKTNDGDRYYKSTSGDMQITGDMNDFKSRSKAADSVRAADLSPIEKKHYETARKYKAGGKIIKKAQKGVKATADSTKYYEKKSIADARKSNNTLEIYGGGSKEFGNSQDKLIGSLKSLNRQPKKGKPGYDANGFPVKKAMKAGGMLKRADGSYSKRGLWDNIRANKGSGKKPTAQMLKQEKKIKAKTKK